MHMGKTSIWEKLDFFHYLPMRTLYNMMMKNGDKLFSLIYHRINLTNRGDI